jgi:16S rRNA (guanine1207-N2)-methyltransferase
MDRENQEGIYGSPPQELASYARSSIQFSPLYPGADSLEALAPNSLQTITIHAPPGTIERRYTLALALKALKAGASFTVLAAKDKGGSRLKKELAELGCLVEEEARSHFRICRATRPAELLPSTEEMILAGSPVYVEETKLWSQPGVFSWNRIDPGSALLVEYLPEFSGFGADLGSGLGFLSNAVLVSKKVKHISLVDVDRRAVEMSRKNVTLARSTIYWADMRDPPEKLRNLDFVVMNPPFHDEGEENQDLGKQFLKAASTMLRSGAACWVTANRHLPYESVMEPIFSEVKVIAEKNGFKIFEAKK